ncbi:protein RIC-3b [Aplochiton taeniatus]
MSMSTFQKVTLATCLVLCVALLLPKMLLSRGKKDAAQAESPGRFPPMAHRQMAPDSQGQRAAGSQFSRAHNPEAVARAKGTGAGTGGKSNLAGQIIPIYGFGILVYILYILFKITSKGNTKPAESRFPTVRSENTKRKITDFELSQLQEKLKETEMVMEKIVSKASNSPERVTGVSADQEESLLLQLREITRVMQEGHLVEGVAPEKKPENWEDPPEEHKQCWEGSHCPACHHGPQSNPETEAEVKSSHEAHGEDDATEDHMDKGEPKEEAQSGNDKEDVDMVAANEKEGADSDSAGTYNQGALFETAEPGVEANLGLADEDLELTLKMTTATEQDQLHDLPPPVDASDGTAVRRRNRKKRAKHDHR